MDQESHVSTIGKLSFGDSNCGDRPVNPLKNAPLIVSRQGELP
ncbi:MAG: hypothetical protein ACFCBU_05580 [Cyanophyceae cyanobacterium]